MLRYLTYRILAAIPVLFVMSVVTFVIIHAPPGDYADYIAMQLRSQGHATNAIADAAARLQQWQLDTSPRHLHHDRRTGSQHP